MNIMKKNLLLTLVAAFLLMAMPQQTNAQFLKNLGKALQNVGEGVLKDLTTPTTTTQQPTTTTTTAQPAQTNVTEVKDQPSAAKVFILGNGSLGPLKKGVLVSTFPKQVEGLYDKFEKKTEETYGDSYDSDETWTIEYYLFTKAGKPVFRANIDEGNKKVQSFTLLEGASNIKTAKGIYVGYSARELFKKNLEWYFDYESGLFCSDGEYYYTVPSEGLVLGEGTPEKITDLKPTAKVSEISY